MPVSQLYHDGMADRDKSGTRSRLLEVATEKISGAPGQNIPLRAICDEVGVKLPTLYHFFGSKQGLIDAVVTHGFATYVARQHEQTRQHEQSSAGDPIDDLRRGWDEHVAFGLNNPGFYLLMYGHVQPGYRPLAAKGPDDVLIRLTRAAADQDRLRLPAELAASHVLAANVGVTLFLISSAQPDHGLSAVVREATVSSITGAPQFAQVIDRLGANSRRVHIAEGAERLLGQLRSTDKLGLGKAEIGLLRQWLSAIASYEDERAAQ